MCSMHQKAIKPKILASENSTGRIQRLMSSRRLFLLAILLLASVACHQQVPGPCSNTSYGAGVVCVNAGMQGSGSNQTNKLVIPYTVGTGNGPHAIVMMVYFCYDNTSCSANNGLVNMTISTNRANPDTCFIPSPHGAFILSGFPTPTAGQPVQTVEQEMWVCENAAGITSITVNLATAEYYVSPSVTEWTGLDTTGSPWDVDAGFVGTTLVKSMTATTPVTHYTNELIWAFTDNTLDEVMTPTACKQAYQGWQGNLTLATLAPFGGQPVSCSAGWTPVDNYAGDGWYATIGAIKTAQSHPQIGTSGSLAPPRVID